MTETFTYLGIVKLDMNLIVINVEGLKDCTVYGDSVEEAMPAAIILVKEHLSQKLKNKQMPESTGSKEVLHTETELCRFLIRIETAGSDITATTIPITDHKKSHYYNLIFGIAKPIKNIIHNAFESKYKDITEGKLEDDPDKEDYAISLKVYNRLLLRYSILRDIERLEKRYDAYGETKSNTESLPATAQSNTQSPITLYAKKADPPQLGPDLRAYRLATTDVFVEKAIAYLEEDSEKYKDKGNESYNRAFKAILYGVYISCFFVMESLIRSWIGKEQVPANTFDLLHQLLPKFTFFGMIILLAVGLCRYGKAMLDQSERLREKRHALRQGRLFVHLKNGELDINELEKAFTWNAYMGNAFGNMPTEAKSPIGGVLSDAKSFSENVAGSVTNLKKKD